MTLLRGPYILRMRDPDDRSWFLDIDTIHIYKATLCRDAWVLIMYVVVAGRGAISSVFHGSSSKNTTGGIVNIKKRVHACAYEGIIRID